MHRGLHAALILGAITASTIPAVADTILTVGPGGQYTTISSAVAAADSDTSPNNYYVIQVMPGRYVNDFPHVTRPMTIEVNPSYLGRAVVLQATQDLPNQKGIILSDANLTVVGLTFTGAHIANSLGGNGAGIRDQNTSNPASLIVRNSTFTGNQEAILTGANAAQTVSIVNSRFLNNGNPDQNYWQHAIYIGAAGSLTVGNSLFCGQLIGHDIKSRAMVTSVYNNRLYDGAANTAIGCNAGSTSYAVDVPNGGSATISGNQIIQGSATQNTTMVAYGEEGLPYTSNSLYLSSNSFTSSGVSNAIGINDPNCVPAEITADNTFVGVATPVSPPQCAVYQ